MLGSKVLDILRKKDQTINQLEEKLETEFESSQNLRVNEDESIKKLQVSVRAKVCWLLACAKN